MTDTEREAQKPLLSNAPDDFRSNRCGHNYPFADCPWENCLGRENVRLLDDARAEIARLRAPPEPAVVPADPDGIDTFKRTALDDLLDNPPAPSAALRDLLTKPSPWKADVMKRAGGVFDEVVALLFDGTRPKPYLRPDAIIPIAAYGDQRAREARAAALEEAAQFIEKHMTRPRPGPLPDAIRALAATPPQSEGGKP